MIGTCCLIFIIILLPPLGVFFMKGCGADFWINVILTLLGYLPGHIHGFYVLVRQREIKKNKKMDKRMRGQKFGSLGHRH